MLQDITSIRGYKDINCLEAKFRSRIRCARYVLAIFPGKEVGSGEEIRKQGEGKKMIK